MAKKICGRWIGVVCVLIVSAFSVGCATAPQPIYHWNGFQKQLYDHFKGDVSAPEDQLRLLTMQAEKAQAAHLPLPPGFRAHMAMIYLKLGREQEAKVQLESEKTTFPESTPYMDFLLKRMKTPKS